MSFLEHSIHNQQEASYYIHQQVFYGLAANDIYVTWRKEDASPVLRKVLNQVQQIALKFNTDQS